jgi:hypothetical protein
MPQASDANKAWTMKAPMINTAQPMSPVLLAKKWFVLMGLTLLSSVMTFAQTNVTPVGGEYGISGPITGEQLHPAVAIGAGGGFVLWDDNVTDPSGSGVSGRRLDASLAPVGDVFRVNQTLGLDQQNARISLLNDGGAVAVWEGGKPGARHVYVRFIGPSGDFVTDESIVNSISFQGVNRYMTNWTLIRNNKVRTRNQMIRATIKQRQEFNANPVVATLADGTVIVAYGSSRKEAIKTVGLNERIVWSERRQMLVTNRTRVPISMQYDYMQDVYAQRLSATGEKLGGEFVLNSARNYNQRNVSVGALTGGGFVACWVSEIPGISARVNSADTPRGGGRVDTYARLFHSDGTPVGPEFRINTTNLACGAPTVVGKADGGFTIAWVERSALRTNGLDVWIRSFDPFGTALGNPVRANAQVFGDQFAPALARVAGNELLVWSSMGQDGSWEGVYARLLQGNATAGDEYRVNTRAYLRQIQPAVSSVGNNAVIIWSSYTFGSGQDVFAQRYQVP